MAEVKEHRTRRIGGYGVFCATRRSAARTRLGVAPLFAGLDGKNPECKTGHGCDFEMVQPRPYFICASVRANQILLGA